MCRAAGPSPYNSGLRRNAAPVTDYRRLKPMSDSPVSVIFDLDGTLIDSSPSILATFAAVVSAHGLSPRVTLNDALIGPPLAATMATITGISDPERLAPLLDAFKRSYDTQGYRLTKVYPGVVEVLDRLVGAGHTVSIATNKRSIPTHRIVEHLGWAGYFSNIYTIDMDCPAFSSKHEMLARLLKDREIDASGAVYVGDKPEDALAASANELRFIAAAWGYGEWSADGPYVCAASPCDLPTLLGCRP